MPPLPPPPPGPPPPGVNFTTSDGLVVGLRNSTRAVQILGIAGDDRWFRNFSFVPPLWGFIPAKPHRDFGGCHHVGDVTLRVQPAASTNGSDWAFYSTSAAADDAPAEPLPFSDRNTFDVANLTAATAARPEDARFPLGVHIVRSVERAPDGYPGFAIRVNISVPAWGAAVRLGGFGFSLVSDTFFGGTNNTAIAASGSFLDAHVGLAAGYATFTRADGSRTLLVTPCSASAALEAWRPLLEEPVPPNEGEWEWTVHSAAWASEWAQNKQAPALDFPDDAAHARAWPAPRSPWPSWHLHETVSRPNPRPWNAPSARVIAPGETASYALCFSLTNNEAGAPTASGAAGGPRALNEALGAAGRAVLVAVPGVVLGGDMASAALFVVPPADAALAAVTSDDPALLTVGALGALVNGFVRVPLAPAPAAHGRARLTLNFTDGTVGSAHYFVLPPLAAHAATYGAFAASTAWLPRNTADAFGRSASFMPWDREDGVHVLQDGRPFVVGLSDDAGAGANLGMAAKLAAAPHAAQLALLDEYVNATLLGVKPDTATPPLFSLQDPVTWRILMTVWYYEKSPENATGYYEELDKCTMGPSWCAFNTPWCDHASGWCAAPPPRDPAVASGWPPGWTPASYRQYNFPHQIATYYALYLAARNAPRLALRNSAEFYLNAAVQSIYTVNCVDAATGRAGCLVTVGLMDGTVFREVLRALKSEGAAWAADAARVEALQRARVFGDGAGGWNSMDNPAGSEFAWDTTGQEEVAVWGAYFNASDAGWMHGELAGRTVDAILGYTGVSATWAFSGSSYGMGDFSNNAKWMVTGGWEREGGHYRSGLNSIPVIERYRAHPDDFHLLRAGIAGMTACLPNIDAAGAPSMAFHTHPFIMDHDPNSGDHGLAYFGHALNSGAYLHNDSVLGLLCFLCDAAPAANGSVAVTPRDSFRVRAYFEPLGLWLVAEAGRFALLTLSGAGGAAGTVAVAFESQADAAAAAGAPRAPYAALRLRVEAPAPAARRFAFTPPAGAAFVRGAWEFPPNADEGAQTVVAVGWARA